MKHLRLKHVEVVDHLRYLEARRISQRLYNLGYAIDATVAYAAWQRASSSYEAGWLDHTALPGGRLVEMVLEQTEVAFEVG